MIEYAIVIPRRDPEKVATSTNGFEFDRAYTATRKGRGWVVTIRQEDTSVCIERFVTHDGDGGAHLQGHKFLGDRFEAFTAGSFEIRPYDLDADRGYRGIPPTYKPVFETGETGKAVVDWHGAHEQARRMAE
jgi:hypothetical protein